MARTHLCGGAVSGFETLEARRMLSAGGGATVQYQGLTHFATLGADGVLEVRGTEGSDEIDLSVTQVTDESGRSYAQLECWWWMDISRDLKGHITGDSFVIGFAKVPLSAVTGIRMLGLGGDDILTVEQRDGEGKARVPFETPVTLLGGDGADTLIGGSGADTFDGGAGADWIDGGESTWPVGFWAGRDMEWWYRSAPPLIGERSVFGEDTVGGMIGVVEPDASGAWVEVVPPPVVPVPVTPVVVSPDGEGPTAQESGGAVSEPSGGPVSVPVHASFGAANPLTNPFSTITTVQSRPDDVLNSDAPSSALW